MEANKSKYSCVSASCGKPLFSEVEWCPYCGTKFVSEATQLKAQEETKKAKLKADQAKQAADKEKENLVAAAAKKLEQEKIKQEAEQAKKEAEKAKQEAEQAKKEAEKVKQEAQEKAQQAAAIAKKLEEEKAKVKETPSTQTPPLPPQAQKSSFGKWLLILIVLGVVGFFGYKKLNLAGGEDAICEQSITDVTGMLAIGDANGALINIKEVLPNCSGDSKNRLTELQNAANVALKVQTATCNDALKQLERTFNRNELLSARKALDKLPANCESFNQAQNLKEKIVQKEDLVKTAEADFDSAISANNFDMAKIALNQLQEATREHANLERMRSQLDEAIRNAQTPDPAPVQVPTPAPAPVQNNAAPVNHQQSQPQVTNSVRDWVDANRRVSNNQVQAPAPANLPNNAADIERAAQNRMTQTFMAEAQNAVQLRRFDVARTQVQNALRVDPNNKDAQLLLRRINDLQLQSLRNQTTID